MRNLQIIEVKYLGATDTKGSRVKLINDRFKESKLINYDYKFNNILDIALDVITKKELIVGYNYNEKRCVYNIILEAENNSFQTLKQLMNQRG